MSKKFVKFLLFVFLLGGILLVLTGCDKKDEDSDSKSNNIANAINDVVQKSVNKWESQGYASTFTLSSIQSSLDENYVIIASGDMEFTNAPNEKKYSEYISDYTGNSYSNTRMLEKEFNVEHCVVLDVKSKKYYDLQIEYKTKMLNDVEKEYPIFKNAKQLK